MKKYIMVISILLSTGAFADEYITSTDTNCQVHNPNPEPNETITWSGSCINGYASGKGTLQWYQNGIKGSKYVGGFRNGKPHGKGTYTYKSGNSYTGDWRDDNKHGKGAYTWADGSVYKGEFAYDKRNGFGVMKMLRGDSSIQSYINNGYGYWQGDTYIIKGMWVDNNVNLECASKSDCRERYERQCDRYYPGYMGRVRFSTFLPTNDEFVVRYVNKQNKLVTIEGTRGGNSLKYGEMREMSCMSLQDHER